MCGEKLYQVAIFTPYPGSPPRVRGKVSAALKATLSNGITPACAGKSPGTIVQAVRSTDHPRVCGEKHSFIFSDDAVAGSPPRVRGKVISNLGSFGEDRITPACAGKRNCALLSAIPPKDHPRVCGEKPHLPARETAARGSPPRVRGKVVQDEK